MSDKKQISKLFWMDLEMTGLDPQSEVIIEVAAVITDLELNVIGSPYHAVVKQPQKYIDAMDEWNQKHHGQSGLIARIPLGKDPALVEKDLIDFVDQHMPKENIILSGNSIFQDRKFIDKYWPDFSKKLHYRMLDVTSWKILFENKYKIKHEKKDSHRAVDDILESIAELKTYSQYIKL